MNQRLLNNCESNFTEMVVIFTHSYIYTSSAFNDLLRYISPFATLRELSPDVIRHVSISVRYLLLLVGTSDIVSFC